MFRPIHYVYMYICIYTLKLNELSGTKVEPKWNQSGTKVEPKWNQSGTKVEQNIRICEEMSSRMRLEVSWGFTLW